MITPIASAPNSRFDRGGTALPDMVHLRLRQLVCAQARVTPEGGGLSHASVWSQIGEFTDQGGQHYLPLIGRDGFPARFTRQPGKP